MSSSGFRVGHQRVDSRDLGDFSFDVNMITFQFYISNMQKLHPGINHPSIEWLKGVFTKTPSVLLTLAAAPTPLNMESFKSAVASVLWVHVRCGADP